MIHPQLPRSPQTPYFLWLVGACLALLFLPSCKAKTAECARLDEPLKPAAADAPARVVSEPADKIAFIYDQSVVRSFELKLAEKDLAFLDANPAAEQYVMGSLVFEGKEYSPVGIRYKGSIGAWVFCVANSTRSDPLNTGGAKTCPKLSMKVSFNEYNPDGKFFGVKKLLFHSMNNDSSLMKERLGYWLFRQMGVPASRAVHVRLLINGKYQGVFLNVEDVDSRFTRSHFADGEGNLYKEIWPTSVDGLTAPLTAERWQQGLQTNQDQNPSFDKVLAFGREVMQEDATARAQAIQNWMSPANTMRFIAVDRTIRADDGPFHFYCQEGACGNHNFFFYEEQRSPRLWLIPWDLDTSFVVTGQLGKQGDDTLKVVNDWDDSRAICEARPGAGSSRLQQLPPSCDPLWNGLGCYFQDDYHAALAELLAGPFSERVVEEKLNAWQAQIADAVQEANLADSRQLSFQDWREKLANFRERTKFLRAQAAAR